MANPKTQKFECDDCHDGLIELTITLDYDGVTTHIRKCTGCSKQFRTPKSLNKLKKFQP